MRQVFFYTFHASSQTEWLLKIQAGLSILNSALIMKKLFGLLFAYGICSLSSGQKFYLTRASFTDSIELSKAMPVLANQVMVNYKDDNRRSYLNNLFRLQILAGKYSDANVTIDTLRNISKESDPQFKTGYHK